MILLVRIVTKKRLIQLIIIIEQPFEYSFFPKIYERTLQVFFKCTIPLNELVR